MFDLKYYNQLAKEDNFYDEIKGNAFSKSNIHRLYNGHKNNKHIAETLINDLPNNDPLKNIIKSMYEKNGEKGLVQVEKILNELCS